MGLIVGVEYTVVCPEVCGVVGGIGGNVAACPHSPVKVLTPICTVGSANVNDRSFVFCTQESLAKTGVFRKYSGTAAVANHNAVFVGVVHGGHMVVAKTGAGPTFWGTVGSVVGKTYTCTDFRADSGRL